MTTVYDFLTSAGMLQTSVLLFVFLTLASEAGYWLGHFMVSRRSVSAEDQSAISTLTGGMVGLLAFTLGLSISFAQSRSEVRRDLVLQEANAIGTAWLRAGLGDDADPVAITRAIEDYARTRLAYITAEPGTGIHALIVRTSTAQTEIWRRARALAQRTPTPITASLIAALNDMFDSATSQQFAFQSRVPANLMLMLFAGSMVAIGALGYQFGLARNRQRILSSLLLLMWTGAMMLIIDMNLPRVGSIRVDPAPLDWTIQNFPAKPLSK